MVGQKFRRREHREAAKGARGEMACVAGRDGVGLAGHRHLDEHGVIRIGQLQVQGRGNDPPTLRTPPHGSDRSIPATRSKSRS